MTRWLLLRALVAASLVVFACGARAEADASGTVTKPASREVLVMLKLPPVHFRPDADYFGGYAAQSGRAGRQRIAEELAARYKLRVVGSWPMASLGVDCFVMEAAADVPIEPVIEGLANDARVESVQVVNLFRSLAHTDPLYRLQPTAAAWHLDELHEVARGKNVRVAVIDSGVELDHPDLRNRVVVARDFVDGRAAVAEAHGTAVAGIIGAAAGNGVGIVGVAPEARLLALRACWQSPANESVAVCSSFTLAKALEFALDQKARVINLSLGGPRDRLLERLLEVATSRGVVIVAAVDPKASDGGFPASFAGALAVAGDDAQDSSAAVYVAPGKDIPAPLPGKRWGFVAGSSYAAAEISGLVALLIDLAPGQSPRQIRENLSSSAKYVSSPPRHAIVDACAAVAKTVGACACGCKMALGSPPMLAQ